MLKDNLVLLRNLHGYTQEELSEKIDISRQAYGKWESGDTIPDIEKCSLLADIYGITLDSLIHTENIDDNKAPLFAPKGKNIWGSVTINNRGQIVIPKEVRDRFNFSEGTRLIVLSDDEEGIALIEASKFEEHLKTIRELARLKF